MNELKIRASYGVLGNLSGIGNYATQSVVYKGMNNMMGTELWEGAITGKEWTSPMNVTWEKTKTLNLGLDFAFLNNKFSVSADYFIQKTEDMLLLYLANLHTSFLCNLIYPTFSRILLYSC